MKVDNFIKKINELKKENKLDLSIGEDLSIGLMNLISLEEHFIFSFMKTENKKFLELLEKIRELRKRLLAKIVKEKEGDYSEKWCISKHLLASTMRLIEVSTKCLHDGKKEEAKELLNDAFEIYSIFWELNGLGDIDDFGKGLRVEDKKMSRFSQIVKKILDCCKE